MSFATDTVGGSFSAVGNYSCCRTFGSICCRVSGSIKSKGIGSSCNVNLIAHLCSVRADFGSLSRRYISQQNVRTKTSQQSIK